VLALVSRLGDLAGVPAAVECARDRLAELLARAADPALTWADGASLASCVAALEPGDAERMLSTALVPSAGLADIAAGGRLVILLTLASRRLAQSPDGFRAAERLLYRHIEVMADGAPGLATDAWIALFRLDDPEMARVPGAERLAYLTRGITTRDPRRRRLVARGIARALSPLGARGPRDVPTTLPPTMLDGQTSPTDGGDAGGNDRAVAAGPIDEALAVALGALRHLLGDTDDTVAREARETLLASAHGLIQRGLFDDTVDLLGLMSGSAEAQADREGLRACLEGVARGAPPLTPPQAMRMESLLCAVSGSALRFRLCRWLGVRRGGAESEREEERLADDVISDPSRASDDDWGWLMSASATNLSHFSRLLGQKDRSGALLSMIQAHLTDASNPALLAGYLLGQEEHRGPGFLDSTLGPLAADRADLRTVLVRAIARGPAIGARVDLAVSLIGAAGDCVGLGAFAVPPWTPDLDLPHYRRLLDAVIGRLNADAKDAGSADAGLMLVLGRIEARMEDRQELAATAQRLLRHLDTIPDDSPAMTRWATLASMYGSQDAPALARRIVERLATCDDMGATVALIGALKDVTKANPVDVWPAVQDHLSDGGAMGRSIHARLPDGYLDIFEPDMLLRWAENRRPDGPASLAQMCPVENPALHPLTRGLLVGFGGDVHVRDIVRDRFVREVNFGLFVRSLRGLEADTLLEQYMAQVRARLAEWERGDEVHVAEWARTVRPALEALEPQVRRHPNGVIDILLPIKADPSPQPPFDDGLQSPIPIEVIQGPPGDRPIGRARRFLARFLGHVAGRHAD